jgi:O-antigen ligase
MTRFDLDEPGGRWLRRIDGVTLLTAFLVIRLGLPSQLVVGPLGGAGSPATLFGIGLLALWGWYRLHRARPYRSAPINAAVGIFAVSAALSYAVAATRPIAAEELSVATLTLVTLAGWVGGLLVASDGMTSVERLTTIVKRLAVLGGVFAAFGLFQFVTGSAWVDKLSIPGLTANQTLYALTVREGFNRPMGTAIHPIEFGAIIGMLMPLMIAYGVGVDPGTKRRGLRAVAAWLPAGAGAMAIALSSSRSALVGLAVGVIGLLPVLTRVQRLVALIAAAVLGVFVFLAVPGMVGTVLSLFTGVSTDPSVASRVESYAMAGLFIARAPILGRGMGTFLPRYRIFDNQYLLTIVETGFLGLAALVLLSLSALVPAVRMVFRAPPSSTRRLLAGALFASCLVGTVCLAFFDGFSFPMMPGLWFVLMGMAGAGFRLTRVAPGEGSSTGQSSFTDLGSAIR